MRESDKLFNNRKLLNSPLCFASPVAKSHCADRPNIRQQPSEYPLPLLVALLWVSASFDHDATYPVTGAMLQTSRGREAMSLVRNKSRRLCGHRARGLRLFTKQFTSCPCSPNN